MLKKIIGMALVMGLSFSIAVAVLALDVYNYDTTSFNCCTDDDAHNIKLMRQAVAAALLLEFGTDDYDEIIAEHGEDAFFAFVNRYLSARTDLLREEISLTQEQLAPYFDLIWASFDDESLARSLPNFTTCPLSNCTGVTMRRELSTGWRQLAGNEGWVMCRRESARNSQRQERIVTPYLVCSRCTWQFRGVDERQTRVVCATTGGICS